LGPVEHAVVVLEMCIGAFPQYTQHDSHGAFAWGKNRAHEQQLDIRKNALREKRSEESITVVIAKGTSGIGHLATLRREHPVNLLSLGRKDNPSMQMDEVEIRKYLKNGDPVPGMPIDTH
jgi:hypothetical protein